MTRKTLLDLNVLIALAESGHKHHRKAHQWLNSIGNRSWGLFPLAEAGFIRVTTNPAYRPGPQSIPQAKDLLQAIEDYPGYSYWMIDKSWAGLP